MLAGNQVTYPWFTQQGAEDGKNKSSTCRRRLPASTSASTTRRTTATRNSANAWRRPEHEFWSSIRLPRAPASRTCMSAACGIRARSGRSAVYGFGAYLGSGHVPVWRHGGCGDYSRRWSIDRSGHRYTGEFKNISAGFAGAAFTFAGFTVAGAWQGGHRTVLWRWSPGWHRRECLERQRLLQHRAHRDRRHLLPVPFAGRGRSGRPVAAA